MLRLAKHDMLIQAQDTPLWGVPLAAPLPSMVAGHAAPTAHACGVAAILPGPHVDLLVLHRCHLHVALCVLTKDRPTFILQALDLCDSPFLHQRKGRRAKM